MRFSSHYPDLMSVYRDVSYMLLLPGVLTTLLEVSAYTCDAQTEERWRVGGWEVFCFWNILIKVGSFNHRLISIGEKREGQELRGGLADPDNQMSQKEVHWKFFIYELCRLLMLPLCVLFSLLFFLFFYFLQNVFVYFCSHGALHHWFFLPLESSAVVVWAAVKDTGRAPPCH